jgi:hypothetical protein
LFGILENRFYLPKFSISYYSNQKQKLNWRKKHQKESYFPLKVAVRWFPFETQNNRPLLAATSLLSVGDCIPPIFALINAGETGWAIQVAIVTNLCHIFCSFNFAHIPLKHSI